MSFLSLKQSLIYRMYDHGVLRDVFFGSRQLSAKILPTLGYKPNPSIPIIFDGFSLKCLKIAWLPGKLKNTVSLRFIFFENYPYAALTCSSLLISSSPHYWELCSFVARFLRSQNWDQVPCLQNFLFGILLTLYESFAWQTFIPLVCLNSHVVRAYCIFESKQAISITLSGRCPNN